VAKGKLSGGLVAATAFHAWTALGAPGAVIPDDSGAEASSVAPTAAPSLTSRQVSKAVGDELARRRLLLAMHQLRMEFQRDGSGTWFLRIDNTKTGCNATEALGAFDVLSPERVQALVSSVTSLVERSHCGTLSPEEEHGESLGPSRPAGWARPVGGVVATASLLGMAAFCATDDPLTAIDTRAGLALYSGLGVGFVGGVTTLFVPERVARPTVELTLASSLALQSLAFGWAPEPGVPAYGEYSAAAGYGLSAALIGADWALSHPHSREARELGATPRAISPWLVYGPATLGALVSVSRAFSPDMKESDREIAAALGLYELAPAVTGLVLGVVGSGRREERAPYEPWIATGPRGSYGLTLGGSF
jgi:hypothetical protein